jgi:hypothetical protein
MRSPAGVSAAAALVLSCAVGAEPVSAGVPGFISPNITWVATIPLDAPGIGGRVLQVGAQRRFYVTGAKGLTIYDVTDPALPVPLGVLPLPHFENESVAVSDDGRTVLIASDPDFGQPPVTYVVDTTNPATPLVASVIPEGSHTVTCANKGCSHVYANHGWIYDISDRENPRKVLSDTFSPASHYFSRDAAGFLTDGFNLWDARTDPENPKRIGVGTRGWHNSLRPNADKYVPRAAGDTSPTLRPGELHIGGDETWLTPGTCDANSAAVTTWSMVNWDKGAKAKPVSTIRPRNGNWIDGNPAVDGVGCSSHWFDYRGGMVAAGWYDHGVRFIKVSETTGVATEYGFFQPVDSMAWAAYWVDDSYVYSVDATRGIDILRVDRSAPAATSQQLTDSWAPTSFAPSAAAAREVAVCRWQATRTP